MMWKRGHPNLMTVLGSPVQCGWARDWGRSRASPHLHIDSSTQTRAAADQEWRTDGTSKPRNRRETGGGLWNNNATCNEHVATACPHGCPPSHAPARQHLNEYHAQTHGPGASVLSRTQQQSLEQVAGSRQCQRPDKDEAATQRDAPFHNRVHLPLTLKSNNIVYARFPPRTEKP